MNEDILKGRWMQVKGDLRKWWGKLTDDDIQRIQGSKERLAGLLQERYGYTQLEAQRHIAEFLEKMEEKFTPQPHQ